MLAEAEGNNAKEVKRKPEAEAEGNDPEEVKRKPVAKASSEAGSEEVVEKLKENDSDLIIVPDDSDLIIVPDFNDSGSPL